ncbi:hypothetical protein TPHA_0J02760 [Tetrapisispora phaffii CBS 4417]|uniref:Ubiquitin-activating enzyme E1-like n=1 Tax=Tetrapisispora phaffii (strain ATCC 24235 / CBS 4417 / NBRC 1672 / NRRL Y-8282 / UCD 70-5) TaxID=1071381 RepID=G8BZ05_TETPH|nr:hypothetical protein TPHA_0J02760 [Tetrapisispora phaffii CBS 4417]CCE65097.1 hypothetical protein TPHA_0J02760 [Tetrapisispora phaffii CBS 4417]
MGRHANVIKIVGEENFQKIRTSKILLIGAGGIGSELLKDLILISFGEIHLVDLDTIDLSNLNRQFLFRHNDIKKAKSDTAIKAVSHFSDSKLVSFFGNIMNTEQFPIHWFSNYDIIFNALDNLPARRYVNKISQFLGMPLMESGTSGFDGYIQPIIPSLTECFDCTKKETPKTFPVCTIRSTPNQPIHCIVWAKNFLFNQLFTNQQTENSDNEKSDGSEKDWGTTDEKEIERIKQETSELVDLQNIVIENNPNKIINILEKLFINDIEKLLLIENLWTNTNLNNKKPTPISRKIINQMTTKKDEQDPPIFKQLDKTWSIDEQILKFIKITQTLMNRLQTEKSIEFDKDDNDTLEFVVTAANIRSYIFGIQMKSIFDSKQLAGNIIPAIATTNAIIAGLSSLSSLRVLNLLKYAELKDGKFTDLNMAFTSKASNFSQDRYLTNPKLATPSCKCSVCSMVVRGILKVSTEKLKTLKLIDLITLLSKTYGYTLSISVIDTKDQRLLADFDFDDLYEKSLHDLQISDGSILFISDEEDENDMVRKSMELYIDVDKDSTATNLIELPKIDVPLITVVTEASKEDITKPEITKLTTSGDEAIVILDDTEEPHHVDNKRPISESDDKNDSVHKKVKKVADDDDDVIELD